MSLFCRHGRFMADCSICSKGTVLDQSRRSTRRSTGASKTRTPEQKRAAGAFSGPHVSAGPFEDPERGRYTVRLERVPGGVRLGEWAGSQLQPRAPIVSAGDLVGLVAGSVAALAARDAEAMASALQTQLAEGPGQRDAGVSGGRSGDFREELRVERLDDGRLRVARWVLRPGAGWELQDAPPMLPAKRYSEALADAAAKGLLTAAPDPAAAPS